jgi:amino acid adenylation domain-containing protein
VDGMAGLFDLRAAELTDAEAEPILAEENNMKADHAIEPCGQELCEVQMEKSSANTFSRGAPNSSRKQEAIRAKCFHPTGTFVEFSKEEVEQSITERFEKIVRMYPDRVAVKSKNQTVTYEALNGQAHRISEALQSERKEITETVALLLGHGTGAVAGILGVLKAARIYVPLDPSYPRARLDSILEDSQAKVVLTDSHNLALAKEFSQGRLRLLNVDDLDASQSTQTSHLFTSPDATAAVFYTSGSTGMPKGVIQSQRAILHRVMTDVNNFHICPDDRLSLVSSPTYSVSLRNLFGALLNGAAVYPFDVEKEGLPQLSVWLQQEEITIYFSVPTVFRKLADCCVDSQSFNALRLIYLAGEPVTRRDVDLWRTNFPSTILINSLASNEAGIIRQLFVDIDTDVSGDKVPAGYAVDGKEILILDDEGKEMDNEQVGEIAVKSRYLSPGYWNNPEMTAAMFRPAPNGGEDRIYQTGDLGYILPDGCLMHLGRKGSRVKIRGSRVELDEVQVNLRIHPAVIETVVDVRKDRSGEEYLIAYVVPVKAQAPPSDELRNHLRIRLPNYMIPSRFVFLDALPLTPNGKLDRRALPDPGKSRPDLDALFVAPRTPVEEAVANIWAEVLSVDQVGINDNFLDLGGHSLLATQIVARVQDCLDVEVPVRTLFESPTVADMAIIIVQRWAAQENRADLERLVIKVKALSEKNQ